MPLSLRVIQHSQCAHWFFILERKELCRHKTTTEMFPCKQYNIMPFHCIGRAQWTQGSNQDTQKRRKNETQRNIREKRKNEKRGKKKNYPWRVRGVSTTSHFGTLNVCLMACCRVQCLHNDCSTPNILHGSTHGHLWGWTVRVWFARSRYVGVRVLHIKPYFLPVNIRHTPCLCWCFILERYKLCVRNNSVKEVCNAMISYRIRQQQYTHASNPGTLEERRINERHRKKTRKTEN